MKNLLAIFICLILFFISFTSIIGLRLFFKQTDSLPRAVLSPPPPFQPERLPFDHSPPSQSLVGKATFIEGEVRKFSRNASSSALLDETQSILEAEEIISSPSATTHLSFGQNNHILVGPETTFSFVSTHPNNFLVLLEKGSIGFHTDETVATISARSQHALFMITQGEATLTTSPEDKEIQFTIASGSAKIGYIDTKNKTQTVDIEAGVILTFNDDKRTFEVSPL